MGFSQSRFLDALRRGSEEEALALYNSKKSVRDSVEPNASLGPAHEGNSVLHYAARHGMVWLYCSLSAKGGKPDLRNGMNQNCLHLVCGAASKPSARKAVLQCALEEGLSGMDVKHVLQERGEEGNTALHLAASSGLMGCVEVLLAYGSDPFLTNKMEQTAADCATVGNHNTIATHLETRMVFSRDDGQNPAPPVEPDHTHLMELAEAPMGMRDSDIRSMKDALLIETSELLGVSLFIAEALLKHHGWSKESLVEEWIRDPAAVCEKAGVQLPQSLGRHYLDDHSETQREVEEEERECGVCALPYHQEIAVPCGHVFCRSCWRDYLHIKIECGDIHSITCPEYGCYKMVPVDVVEEVVSKDMAQRYLHFDIKAFVDSNPNIRWCPHPNCHRAVRISANADDQSPNRATQPSTVQCGNEHYFCWLCAGEPHDPCDCETWQRWLQHVETMRPRIGHKTSSELDNAATQKWLARRSKPCPKCHAPIEKTEGCNHMCCRKCKHAFCWVCLDEWKQHNSSTGGYFECNRYDVRKKADTMLQKRTEKVMEGLKEVELLRRFLHYYERYNTHRDSLALEQPFLQKAHHKMVKLLKSVAALDGVERGRASDSLDLSFIEEAVRELLAARRVLIASYPFSYYIQGSTARRAFENMQGALEEVTELMAQVVARPHLRKPRLEIIRLTRECREKRLWLLKNSTDLPRPSPPSRRPKHRSLRRLPDDSESSSGSSDGPTDERFLDQFRRRASHSRASQASAARQSRQEELEILLLQMSRLEYEEQRQLQADIDLAKELSLKEVPTTQPAPIPSPELQFLGVSSTHAASSSSGMDTAPLTLSMPCQGAAAGHGGGGTSLLNFLPNTATAGSSCADRSSPSNGGPACEEDQQGWEDEELARALSLSLLDQQAQQGQQERDTGDNWINLPPELRHLLQDGNRNGQSV